MHRRKKRGKNIDINFWAYHYHKMWSPPISCSYRNLSLNFFPETRIILLCSQKKKSGKNIDFNFWASQPMPLPPSWLLVSKQIIHCLHVTDWLIVTKQIEIKRKKKSKKKRKKPKNKNKTKTKAERRRNHKRNQYINVYMRHSFWIELWPWKGPLGWIRLNWRRWKVTS